MRVKEIDFFVRNQRELELVELAEHLAKRFRERAAVHDLEGTFPYENFRDLRDFGYLKLTIPREYGGDELCLYELLMMQERLAWGDGSTALSVGWHVGLLLELRTVRSWPTRLFEDLCKEVISNGARINKFASESVTGSPTSGGKPMTTAKRTKDGWLLHIPACYLGIAFAARDFAIDFASNHQPNSIHRSISELPHIQTLIGEIEAELKTARTLLYATAEKWDLNIDSRVDLKAQIGLAKYIATNSALSILDKAMRIVGGLSLYRRLPLERMYRDVRAGLHNPPMDDAVIQELSRSALQEISR